MSDTLIRDCAIVAALCVGAVAWFQSRPVTVAAAPAVELAEAPAPVPRESTGGEHVIRASNGQFFTDGFVNSSRARFLVDTGASAVALTSSDARAAGLDPSFLVFDVRVSTANGEGRAARVTLDALSVGPITERDVPALVVEEGLEISLLGMTFLRRLQAYEASADTLTLRL